MWIRLSSYIQSYAWTHPLGGGSSVTLFLLIIILHSIFVSHFYTFCIDLKISFNLILIFFFLTTSILLSVISWEWSFWFRISWFNAENKNVFNGYLFIEALFTIFWISISTLQPIRFKVCRKILICRDPRWFETFPFTIYVKTKLEIKIILSINE